MEVAAGHHQLVADPQPPSPHRLTVRIERVPQREIEGVDPELAPVHRREHLDVRDRVDVEVSRQPLADQRDDLRQRRTRVGTGDQEQVAAHLRPGGERRHLAAANRVGPLDDHAPGRLAEDVGEEHGRHAAGGDELGERLARPHRRQLIGVADEHDVGPGAHRPEQRDHQLQVGHRALVDDQQVAFQRRVLIASRPLAGHPARAPSGRSSPGPRSTRSSGSPRGRSARPASPWPPTRSPYARSCGSMPSCRSRALR